ncbi:GNAT family N-acetyltransferase [Paraburkholderia sp.]|uniref:GNAT family N-acetyltransferase n=1 Tax=Paraburkholderia sp. TaxID=1926495 RepID=UPI0023933D80|nr:GNAT family N-acetyltransferase [Paraburkholderia sp.]MDE1182446.1 GNAT family N-acetyltransferase [Paraburkholderia sp.]
MNGAPNTAAARVAIRVREVSDLDAIAALMNCPGTRHGTLQTPYRSHATVAKWLDRMPANTLGLCAEVDGRVVGLIDVLPRPHRMAHSAGVGIAVHDDYVGRGVGTALLAAALDRADSTMGLRRLELTVFVDNHRAIGLYTRFGFVEEGRSPAFAMRDGMLVDVFHMARFAAAPRFASALPSETPL